MVGWFLVFPALILKLYVFQKKKLCELFPLHGTKGFLFNARATDRTKKMSINFIDI
jgi:hypothetical protein